MATRLYRHGNSRISSEIRVPGAEPYYFLISTGGGYTEGEHYDVDIRVGEGAHAVLWVGGSLVAVDRLAAAPGEGCSVPIEGMGGFEGYTNFGSALIVD